MPPIIAPLNPPTIIPLQGLQPYANPSVPVAPTFCGPVAPTFPGPYSITMASTIYANPIALPAAQSYSPIPLLWPHGQPSTDHWRTPGRREVTGTSAASLQLIPINPYVIETYLVSQECVKQNTHKRLLFSYAAPSCQFSYKIFLL